MASLQGREIVAPMFWGGGVYYVRSFTGGDLGAAGSVRHYGIKCPALPRSAGPCLVNERTVETADHQ